MTIFVSWIYGVAIGWLLATTLRVLRHGQLRSVMDKRHAEEKQSLDLIRQLHREGKYTEDHLMKVLQEHEQSGQRAYREELERYS